MGEKLVSRLAPKVRRREETRERKAEAAAKIERALERELIERLRSGAYGDRPLNVDHNVWRRVMQRMEKEGDGVRDKDMDEGIEEVEEYEVETVGADRDSEYVSDIDESDEDMEDFEDWLGGESGDEESASEDEEDEDSDSADEDDDQPKTKQPLKRTGGKPPPTARPAKKRGPKGPAQKIEYEYERVPEQRETLMA